MLKMANLYKKRHEQYSSMLPGEQSVGGPSQVGRVEACARQHVSLQQRQHGAHQHAAATRLDTESHALHQALQTALAAAPEHNSSKHHTLIVISL